MGEPTHLQIVREQEKRRAYIGADREAGRRGAYPL